jgi:hypothetical protein
MRCRLATFVLPILLTACATQNTPQLSVDDRFERLSSEFIQTHYDHRPLAAVSLGWHQYDGQFQIRDAANIKKEKKRLREFDNLFHWIQSNSEFGALTPQHEFELNLIKSTIRFERWVHESQRVFERNPMTYVDQLDVSPYLIRDFKPLDQRFADIAAILQKAPKHLSKPLAKISPPLSRGLSLKLLSTPPTAPRPSSKKTAAKPPPTSKTSTFAPRLNLLPNPPSPPSALMPIG